ncbi:MAG TPA: ABC transporter permease [Gemmatimonadaceae bacterium]|jgi:putative ABC transport system permease protein
MSIVDAVRFRLRTLLQPERHARELEEEIRLHLDLDAMNESDALRRFGNATGYREETREMSAIGFLDMARQDLRFALRTLRSHPAFTAVAVLTIALGIGATTAIFSVVNAVMLRPLPYRDAARVTMVWMDNRRSGNREDFHSVPNFSDIKSQSRSFSSLALFREGGLDFTGAGEPQRMTAGFLPAEAFATLGVAPIVGHIFDAGNEVDGSDNVALLSYGLWQSLFAGAHDVVGKTIELNARRVTIVGVMPRDFTFPAERDQLWVPLVVPEQLKKSRNSYAFPAIGRLKDGVPLAAARSDVSSIAKRLEQQFPSNRDYGVTLTPLPEHLVGPSLRSALWIMLAAVAAVLIIACANVANLLLSRAAVREREVTVRMALGASNRRLIRQFLTESVLLSLIGGTVGLAFGAAGLRALRALAPSDIPRAASIGLDPTVLLVALAATLTTGLLFGLVPAIQTSRTRLSERLRDGGHGGTGGRAGQRVRRGIVAAQLALVVVLLTAAGLLTRTFVALQNVDLAFTPHNVLTMTLQVAASRYQKPQQVGAFYEALLQRMRALPGVTHVGAVTTMMLSNTPNSGDMTAEGRDNQPSDDEATFDSATPDFFNTVGARIVRGRAFDTTDQPSSPPVSVVNEHLAKRYWPTTNAVGKRFHFGGTQSDTTRNPWITVVGVVADMRRTGVDLPVRDEMFVPFSQDLSRGMIVMLKTSGNPLLIAPQLRELVRSIDRDQAIVSMRPLDAMLASLIAERRFSMMLVAAFAALAFALAIIGAYGVTSYFVSQRTKEIGIRVALGADASSVTRLIVFEGMRVAVAGVLVGVIVAMLTTRLAANLLFGVSPRDPLTVVVVAIVLLLVAALANYLPARRASRVDPLVALRQE